MARGLPADISHLNPAWPTLITALAALGTLIWVAVFPPLAIPFALAAFVYGRITYRIHHDRRKNRYAL